MTGTGCTTALDARAALNAGTATATGLIGRSLDRIRQRDSAVLAWAHLDKRAALRAAIAIDDLAVFPPLAGAALGVKDIIDVAGMPTGHGSPIFAGQVAKRDAECVARLRVAGAIVVGKTVTAEFATYSPGATINPHRRGHTPGGSSSGSAAAVADHQVAIALGTQTAGSMIRPASYCGVFGFKPSFGRYPLDGVLTTSPSLDTLGVFARTLADICAVDEILAREPGVAVPDGLPVVGLCRSPAWQAADASMQQAFLDFADRLRGAGFTVIDHALPPLFDELAGAQEIIHRREAFEALGPLVAGHPDAISAVFRDFIDAGAAVPPAAYKAARTIQQRCKAAAAEAFDGVDMLLVPGATGAAPAGLKTTGNPAFQRLWTALGAPCLGFPADQTADLLPLGLQLVAAPGRDRELLAAAASVVACRKD